jgi:hypothetical protein
MESLNVKSLALGLGGSCAVGMLFLGWVSAFGWGMNLVEVISSFYIGFTPGFVGGIIGAIWGFVDGAIGGAIIALIYNAVIKKK